MQKGVDYIGISVSHICHDGRGNYLLNKRGVNCRDEHGTWDFGAGGLNIGETVEDCLKREMKEEHAVEPARYEFLGYLDLFRNLNGVDSHWLILVFLVFVDHSKVKNNEPDKFENIGWFKLDNLPRPLHSGTSRVLEKFRDKLPQ